MSYRPLGVLWAKKICLVCSTEIWFQETFNRLTLYGLGRYVQVKESQNFKKESGLLTEPIC